jgi:hypothetical protein
VDERTVRRWVADPARLPAEREASLRQAYAASANRIGDLGATVFKVPARDELPALCARIVRLWAELHAADRALALELAAKLPGMTIRRG